MCECTVFAKLLNTQKEKVHGTSNATAKVTKMGPVLPINLSVRSSQLRSALCIRRAYFSIFETFQILSSSFVINFHIVTSATELLRN